MDSYEETISDVASMLRIASTDLRALRTVFQADLVSGAPATEFTLRVPKGYVAVITSIEVDSYPMIGGDYDFTRRQPYSYADELLFQWSTNGRVLTEQEDYHLWLGDIFFVNGDGTLTLAVQLNNNGPAIDSQFTNLRVSGVFAPAGKYTKELLRLSMQRL